MNTHKAISVPLNLLHVHELPRNATSELDLPAGAIVTIRRGAQSLDILEQDWKALAADCGNPVSAFQSFEWTKAWCKSCATNRMEVLLVLGYQSGRLVFIWPLMKTVHQGLSTLEWLTFPSGQYGDVLLARGHDSSTWLQAALALLKASEPVDLMRLRHVRQGSSFNTFAEQHMIKSDQAERAPFMDLTRFASVDDYEKRYTGEQRKRRKKIRKKLEEMGEVSFRTVPQGPETDRAIAMAVAEKNEWLSARGRINRVMKCPCHLAFLKDLARVSKSGLEVVVTEMTAGGAPVSWEIAFRQGGVHFAYLTSHVNTLTDLSPGRLHMHYSQVKALQDGMTRFDLMVPYDLHKESWATGMVNTLDYYLPMSARGRILGELYLGRVRPALRKAYYALSPSILKVLSPLTKMVA